MYSPEDVSGFLLLTLPNCTVDAPSLAPQTGTLSLECVTLNLNQASLNNADTNKSESFASNEPDIWLVLKLNSFEMVVSPTQRINYSRTDYTYIFLPEPGQDSPRGASNEFIRLVVPPDPNNPTFSAQDLETMEVILSQYGVLHDIDAGIVQKKGAVPPANSDQPPPYTQSLASSSSASASASATVAGQRLGEKNGGDAVTASGTGTASISDFKGHLVLMDQADGAVIGTLDENVQLREDKALSVPKEGGEKDPVVIEFPGDEEEVSGKGTTAYVHLADEQDRDILIRTAGLVSNGIVFLSSALSSGITSLADFYIAHSTPSTKTINFSPSTNANMKRIHNISGAAVKVTSRTTNAIFKLVDVTINKFASSGNATTSAPSNGPRPPQVTVPPPPLPPRKGKEKLDADNHPPPLPPRTLDGSNTSSSVSRPVGDSIPPQTQNTPPGKTRLLNRVLASTDIILTALEQSATQLIDSGTDAVSRGISHKYGNHAGDLSRLAGGTVRNVSLVYVDLQGVGRRALIKRAGKAVVKAKFAGRDVVFMNGTENATNQRTQSQGPNNVNTNSTRKGAVVGPGKSVLKS